MKQSVMDDAKEALDLEDSKIIKRQNAVLVLVDMLNKLDCMANDGEQFEAHARAFLVQANKLLKGIQNETTR